MDATVLVLICTHEQQPSVEQARRLDVPALLPTWLWETLAADQVGGGAASPLHSPERAQNACSALSQDAPRVQRDGAGRTGARCHGRHGVWVQARPPWGPGIQEVPRSAAAAFSVPVCAGCGGGGRPAAGRPRALPPAGRPALRRHGLLHHGVCRWPGGERPCAMRAGGRAVRTAAQCRAVWGPSGGCWEQKRWEAHLGSRLGGGYVRCAHDVLFAGLFPAVGAPTAAFTCHAACLTSPRAPLPLCLRAGLFPGMGALPAALRRCPGEPRRKEKREKGRQRAQPQCGRRGQSRVA